MKQWTKAKSSMDVATFYDAKYAKDGYDALRRGKWDDYIAMLEYYGGKMEPPKMLLDAGCGHAEFVSSVCSRLDCIGIDISEVAVRLASERLKTKAWIHRIDIMDMHKFYKSSFDYVTCLGALEHTMDPKIGFSNLYSAVKDGGILLINVPLETDDCLNHILAEPNPRTNERFASMEEWVEFFELTPENSSIIGQDAVMVYRKV